MFKFLFKFFFFNFNAALLYKHVITVQIRYKWANDWILFSENSSTLKYKCLVLTKRLKRGCWAYSNHIQVKCSNQNFHILYDNAVASKQQFVFTSSWEQIILVLLLITPLKSWLLPTGKFICFLYFISVLQCFSIFNIINCVKICIHPPH